MPKVRAKVNLFSQWYTHSDATRKKEIDLCLEINKGNPFIEKIYTFSRRPTYDNFFSSARKFSDDINIFANADIYFDDSLEEVYWIEKHQAYAITRWEEMEDGKVIRFEERNTDNRYARAEYAQDVWVIRGAPKQVYGGFFAGIPGCDNRIAAELMRHYQTLNPLENIRCIHKHLNPHRNYVIPDGCDDHVARPWKWVPPCRIHSDGRIEIPSQTYYNPKYNRVAVKKQ